MLKEIFKKCGRRRPEELITALLALSHTELVQGIVKLFTSGELRFRTKKQALSAQEMCSKFYRHHSKNPHVAEWFLRTAQALREQHRSGYSIGALTEQIRWDIKAGIIKTDGFRMANEVRACYARLVVMRDPSLCGLFEIHSSVMDGLLVIDGCSWSGFAKEYHAELWPERKPAVIRKQPASVPAVQTRKEELA